MMVDGKYAWKGKVIRLTPEDYTRWKVSFSNIELGGCLEAKDAELSVGTEAEKKRWFASTAMWLMAMNNTQSRLRENDDRKASWFNDPHRGDPFAVSYDHLKRGKKQ